MVLGADLRGLAGLAYALIGLVGRLGHALVVRPGGRGTAMTAAAISAPTAVGENISNRAVARAVLRRVGVALIVVVAALVVLTVAWIVLLRVFQVSTFVGKTPGDVFGYLFTADVPGKIRPRNISLQAAQSQLLQAWTVTLDDAAIGFVSGTVVAVAIAASFMIIKPFEFAFMPIAMLLRSVPLVAMAPVLLLIFGQSKVGTATIGAIVVLFPVLGNMVLGLRSASPLFLDLIRANGGSRMTTLTMVQIPSARPALSASIRISVPGAIVVVSVVTSIIGYAVATVLESAALAAWRPEAGKHAGR